jgi:anti-sigma B factor antagonist
MTHVDVTIERHDRVLIIRPVGEIDLARSPSLRVQMMQLQDEPYDRLIIDLGGVPYMDSSGVATLVEAMQAARRMRRSLVVCSLQDKVRSIFEIAKLDSIFTLAADVDEAKKK